MMIVGHRGAKGYEPENTLRSFQRAVECGVDAIEFDVRFTNDARPVVIHDETLERTTNGFGKVSGRSLAEIRELDAGEGERVPTLEEALDFAFDNGLHAFVELKEPFGVGTVLEILHSRKGPIVLISFLADTLKYVAFQNERVATGLIFNRPVRHRLGFLNFALSCGATWILGRRDVLDRDLVAAAKKQSILVEAWVANDPDTARTTKEMGVDAVASDCPDAIRGL